MIDLFEISESILGSSAGVAGARSMPAGIPERAGADYDLLGAAGASGDSITAKRPIGGSLFWVLTPPISGRSLSIEVEETRGDGSQRL
jgi:hypothetical protein